MSGRTKFRSAIAAVVLLVLTPAAWCEPVPVEDVVLARVAEFSDSFKEADVNKLDEMIHPDYIHTNTGGGVVDRPKWLAWVTSRRAEILAGKLILTKYENRDLEVRMHGDVAIVTGLNVSAGVRDGAPFERELRFTQVWRMWAGDWLRLAYHDTEVSRP